MTAAITYHAVLPTTRVYIRRRVLVGVAALAVVLGLGVGAGNVLANRGGLPASASTASPATYVVHAGDTLWSIAVHHHGHADLSAYVDALVSLNGGSHVQVGQQIALP